MTKDDKRYMIRLARNMIELLTKMELTESEHRVLITWAGFIQDKCYEALREQLQANDPMEHMQDD